MMQMLESSTNYSNDSFCNSRNFALSLNTESNVIGKINKPQVSHLIMSVSIVKPVEDKYGANVTKKNKMMLNDDLINLIENCLRGEEASMEIIYNKYYKKIYRILYGMLYDTMLAEETANDTFVIAFQKLHTLQKKESFESWIIGIALNLARNARRKYIKQKGIMNYNGDIDSPHATSKDSTLDIAISKAVASLPNGYKKVFVLHDLEGFNHVEIGKILGLDPGTSKSQLFKARRKLREVLKKNKVSEFEERGK